jgi:hypothetical protein
VTSGNAFGVNNDAPNACTSAPVGFRGRIDNASAILKAEKVQAALQAAIVGRDTFYNNSEANGVTTAMLFLPGKIHTRTRSERQRLAASKLWPLSRIRSVEIVEQYAEQEDLDATKDRWKPKR